MRLGPTCCINRLLCHHILSMSGGDEMWIKRAGSEGKQHEP
ncbi:hypothetical protein HMPREF3197_01341 [Klebsiella pneumoniae]|nr:hypothetical protein HMPREF9538_06200 [Klebsiella sp. MS 92-3]KXA28237.1 hypothetical protein HMPREF3197_01341 [Klebsiella pneumoniae]